MISNKDLLTLTCNFIGQPVKKQAEYEELEKKIDDYWYSTNETNMAFYDSKEYLYITYLCYKKYSKGFITISKPVIDKYKIDSILDYGAGSGLTTLLISELWPDKEIIYQNLKSKQYNFAKNLLNDKKITFIDTIDDIKVVDCIFALELFEHIKEPLVLLNKMISKNPKVMVISNSFSAKAYGHYSEFLCTNVIKSGNMSRLFNKELKDNGYILDEDCKKFWNRRPAVWIKG